MSALKFLTDSYVGTSYEAKTVTAITATLILGYFLLKPRQRVSIRGKYIVVTGCDTGLGQAFARALIAAEANAICLCYTQEGVDEAYKMGAKLAFKADLSILPEVESAAVAIKEECSAEGLFGVIHNAGIIIPAFIDYQPIDNYKKVMDVNYFAVVALTAHLLPLLKDPDVDGISKRVAVVSSVDGLVPLCGNAAYDASKHAVEAYADCLRTEQSFWNISVSVLNPATIATPLTEKYGENGTRVHRECMKKFSVEDRVTREYSVEWAEAHYSGVQKSIPAIAEDVSVAVTAAMDSMTARVPRTRYLIGKLANTLFYFLWVCPPSWAGAFKRSMVTPPPFVERNKK